MASYIFGTFPTLIGPKRENSLNLISILQTSLEEKNTKPFYRYIKAQKNDNFGISSLKFNGLMYSDSSSKSEILNKQFQSVFTKKKHHNYS